MSHHTNSRNPTAAAHPVMRCRMDSDIVYMNLYTPRWGDSGRWFIVVPLKIDAAAILFPIAETRGLGALRTADFDGRGGLGGLRGVAAGAASRRGGGNARGNYVGRGIRHGREFCQNRPRPTT